MESHDDVLTRIKQDGAVCLDVGCCVGQNLRELAHAGASPEQLIGIDLQPSFIELGYDLFRDREAAFGQKARFGAGDLLASPPENEDPFKDIYGKVDIIVACKLFHLFERDDQLKLGERLIRFFRPDATAPMLVGIHIGADKSAEDDGAAADPSLRATGDAFLHDPDTWKALWDDIGARTGTRWDAQARMHVSAPESQVWIEFTIRRVD
jgi:SAM-dependent methyltransferase